MAKALLRRRESFWWSSPVGGLFQFSVQLGEAIARTGADVEVITGPKPELSSREAGCRVRAILPTWHPTAGADAPQNGVRPAAESARDSTAGVAHFAGRTQTHSPRRGDLVGLAIPDRCLGVRAVRRALPHAVLGLIAHEPRAVVEQSRARKACSRRREPVR